MMLCRLFQSEPEDHAGAGEAQSGAWETQIHRPGEEPQAAWAYVRLTRTHTLFNSIEVCLFL